MLWYTSKEMTILKKLKHNGNKWVKENRGSGDLEDGAEWRGQHKFYLHLEVREPDLSLSLNIVAFNKTNIIIYLYVPKSNKF